MSIYVFVYFILRQNNTRKWSNNSNVWLSEKPFFTWTVICFHFLLQCLCGPVCFSEGSCLHCVRGIIEGSVWAKTTLTLPFSCFWTHSPPLGPLQSLEMYLTVSRPQECCKEKNLKKNMYLWLSGPAFLFLPNPKNLQYVPCGYTFESKIGHFLFFLKARSQDTPFLERSLWTLWTWICSWRLLRAEQTVYLEVQSD